MLSLVPITNPDTGATWFKAVDRYAEHKAQDELLASALCIELTVVCSCADGSVARSYELVFSSPADSMTAHELAHRRARELMKIPRVNAVNLKPLAEQLPAGLTLQLRAMHNAVLFARAQGVHTDNKEV